MDKINKYKSKYKLYQKLYLSKYNHTNIFNLIGGDICDTEIAKEYINGRYTKQYTNLLPYNNSDEDHSICSYSIWNESKTQLYIPTKPNNDDKVFKYLNYYIRFYKTYFMDSVRGKPIEETYNDGLLWSNMHQNWYTFASFPNDDNTIEKLAMDFNINSILVRTEEPIIDLDERGFISMFLQNMIGMFLMIKNKLPGIKNNEERINVIYELLDEAEQIKNSRYNTASPDYIKELYEILDVYDPKPE